MQVSDHATLSAVEVPSTTDMIAGTGDVGDAELPDV
jgi:hypothetical protein